MKLVKSEELPFHAVTRNNLTPPRPGHPDPPREGRFASPDALLSPSYMAAAATDPEIRIEPAWKVSIVYGMPCAIYHMLPATYYLPARFHNDFESAVLHAVNGGGQNQARAILAGALTGAQTGCQASRNVSLMVLKTLTSFENWPSTLQCRHHFYLIDRDAEERHKAGNHENAPVNINDGLTGQAKVRKIDTCHSKCDSMGLDIFTQITHNKGKPYYVYHAIEK